MDEKEVTGIRAWLRSKATMIKLYSGAAGAVIGLMVAYQQFGGPLPATQSDITELRQEIGSISQLILGNSWRRLTAEIKVLTEKLARDPTNRELIEELTVLEFQLRAVNRDLK